MLIRRFEPHDRDQVIALWKKAFPDDPPHNEPAAVLDAKLAVDDLIMVARDGDESVEERCVGACMGGYDGHRGWLYAVAVSPDHRRRGIGRGLVQETIRALRATGCIKVNLQIRADNQEVADFYRSLGFSVEARVSMGLLLE